MVSYRKAKRTGKRAVKGVKRVIKNNYGGKKGISSLIRDVASIKALVNVEKKVWQHTGGALAGQQGTAGVNGVGQSLLSFRIPQGIHGGPQPGVSGSNGQRIGNSIKATGCNITIQVNQQTSTSSEIRYKIVIVRKKECVQPQTATQVLDTLYEPNPFLLTGTIIDYHSDRYLNTYPQYQILKTVHGKLNADQIASQVSYNVHKIPLKLNFHLTYNGTGTLDPLNNNLYMFVMCDSGQTSLNTGIVWQYTMKLFYVDN